MQPDPNDPTELHPTPEIIEPSDDEKSEIDLHIPLHWWLVTMQVTASGFNGVVTAIHGAPEPFMTIHTLGNIREKTNVQFNAGSIENVIVTTVSRMGQATRNEFGV